MAVPYPQINDTPPRTQAIAGLNQFIYSTTWTANQASDILVYTRAPNVPASDVTQLVPSTNYTVQFIGSDNLVQVTFNSMLNPPQYNIVTIVRNTPSDWLNNYTNTNFLPSMLNADFDTLTFVDQQNQLWNQVAPHYNYSATINIPIDTILPVLGASQFWIKNSTNTAFVAATLGESGEFPVLGPFVLYAESSQFPDGFSLGTLGNGLLAQNVTDGVSTPYVVEFPINVPDGGTGLTTITPYAVLLGGTTDVSSIAPLTDLGAAGQVLTSSGPGAPPSWQTPEPAPSYSIVSSQILLANSVNVTTTTTYQNLTTITLTEPGTWMLFGNVFYLTGLGTTASLGVSGISLVSATPPDFSLINQSTGGVINENLGVVAPSYPITISETTTVYLLGYLEFSGGTATMCGNLYAYGPF